MSLLGGANWTTLLIATRNPHKLQEIRAILGERFRYLSLNDFPNAPAVAEDAATFAGNAAEKALALAQWLAGRREAQCGMSNSRSFVLADDSGLEVDALNGAPGVHSARFAAVDMGAGAARQGRLALPRTEGGTRRPCRASNFPDAANNAKLLRLLDGMAAESRSARFRCVLAVVEVIGHSAFGAPQLFEGVCEGRISLAPSGTRGFGYDSLFVPLGYEKSFAELGEEVKNKISHRAKALENVRVWLRTQE